MLREVKVFTIDAMSSNSMKSSNPHSGIHEVSVAKCLDTMCLDPSCNQGGHMIVIALEGNGARPSHLGKGFSEDGMMYTLNTIEQHSVCFPVECIGHDIRSTQFSKGGCCDTLTANDFKDPTIVCYAIENHPCDSRVTLTTDGIFQTLNARMGTGGGNTPIVLMENKEVNGVDMVDISENI